MTASGTAAPENKKKSSFSKWLFFFARILLASAIILWLVHGHGKDILKAFEKMDYLWLAIAAVLYFVHLLAGAWRWYLLLKLQKVKISMFEAFSILMQGFFFSLVIPGGAIGGDLIKIGLVSARTPKGLRVESGFTILIDRFLGMIGLFTITPIVGILGYSYWRHSSPYVQGLVWALIAISLVGLSGGVVVMLFHKLENFRFIAYWINLADKYLKGSVSRMVRALDHYRSAWKLLIFSVVMSIVLIHMNLVLVIALIIKGLGQAIPGFVGLTEAVTLGNTAGLIPITPGGIGPREFMMSELLKATGMPKVYCDAVVLIFLVLILCFNLCGGIFFIFGGARKPKVDLHEIEVVTGESEESGESDEKA